MLIRVTDVNDAYNRIIPAFQRKEGMVEGRVFKGRRDHTHERAITLDLIEQSSRNGKVRRCVHPVIIAYENPTRRVLFNSSRDANPFFHLLECVWMISGSNWVAPMEWLVSTMGDYSDDGKRFWGAYGFRWNEYFMGRNQILGAINQLKKDRNDRRVVVGMWDPMQDTLQAVNGGKDVPCNIALQFQIIEGRLSLSVINRSNDILWGALGANAVHMSFLQEMVAEELSIPCGVYYQISNNLHAYIEHPKWPTSPPVAEDNTYPYDVTDIGPPRYNENTVDEFQKFMDYWNYGLSEDLTQPLSSEVAEWCGRYVDDLRDRSQPSINSRFLLRVARPMLLAYHHYKRKDFTSALYAVERIASSDWRVACYAWMVKRRDRHEARK